ncbi:MAG: hypothetical protein M1376_13415 [Planctomycetes bacterium]|nr:hypothetical protein [Planctomycetota bacterium]
MRTRDYIVVFVGLALAVGLLYAAGAQLDSINAQRQTLKLVINPPTENMPPSLAFATVAMGAFRGLVVDILWMRADKLKEEGQFFDARQLAEWITKLQPRFGAVWEFQAWNMAYNISVAIPNTQPEQRWRWVKNGYELLRDEGIPLNPKSIQLYQELARIFQHKLGGVSDDCQEYYKLQFAEEIGPLLESADNGLGREDDRYFQALIRAPADWTQIAKDPNVAGFLQAIRAADESLASDESFVKSYLALRQEDSTRAAAAGSAAPAGEDENLPPSKFKPAVFQTLDTWRGTEALKRFDIFAKAYQLRHVWKLDPALMRRVSQMYGPVDFQDPNKHFPFDWRHPDSHAIYWAVKGLEIARQQEDREIGMQEVNTDRMVLHSLQNLFRYGKITILQGWERRAPKADAGNEKVQMVARKDIFLAPDPRIFASYEKAYREVYQKYVKDRGRDESFANGHRNMLKNAVLVFYQAGLKGEATKIYNILRKEYALDEFKVPLEQFARNRILEEMDGLGIIDASEQIMSLLINAYGLYAVGDDNASAANEQLAQQVWDHYYATFGDNERINLPPIRVLRYAAVRQFLGSDAYPDYIRAGLLARIEREKPQLMKELQQTDKEVRQQIEELQKTQKP